jgi:4-amino-4-deoxy-L-arabinose transferase-like glycosyltransferase
VPTPEARIAEKDLHLQQVRWSPQVHPVSTVSEQRKLESDLNGISQTRGTGAVGQSGSQPPLYYALEVVPYALGHIGSLLDALEMMRLMSALLGGVAAFFIFMFLREALPSSPWAWTAGGVSAALAPLLGMMSGAVNPDVMLVAVSAAAFFALARAFRRGFSQRAALLLGVVMAIGFLTKENFVGLVPGIAIGVLILTARTFRTEGRAALVRAALALGLGLSPVFLYLVVNLLSGDKGFGLASGVFDTLGKRSPTAELSYVWQLYLPRLPGMTGHLFPGLTPTHIWFDRWVGLYGWLDTSFAPWVDELALIPAGLLLALCTSAAIAGRGGLRGRRGELLVYGLMGIGLMATIAIYSGTDVSSEGPAAYVQPRYLLPLLPLAALVIAMAARGLGRRMGPALGIVIVVLFLAHDIFSQLLVIARFYS